MSRTTVPLPVIDVAEPCPADWSEMIADGASAARFCAHCQRHVHDLSAMHSDEVADLICRNAGRLCVRFERALDGRVKTLDYEAPMRRGLGMKWVAVALLAAIGVGGARAAWQRHQANIANANNMNMVAGMMAPIAPPPVTAPASAANGSPLSRRKVCP